MDRFRTKGGRDLVIDVEFSVAFYIELFKLIIVSSSFFGEFNLNAYLVGILCEKSL